MSITASGQSGESAGRMGMRASLLVPIGLIGLIAVILLPLPPMLLDALIVMNLGLATLVLLTAVQTASPLDFSVFPTVLLGATLLRLVLNVASTRLILTADAGSAVEASTAAGHVIEAFGGFVIGGSLAVGVVIFLILLVVQFVVVTKGASRVSEVAARFALDAMPGRQMAIDADLGAGLIEESEARLRRDEISRQADFYGAMDGASKFVRGDAIAGLVITSVNIIGGMAVGVIGRGWSVGETAQVFTRLTIGDGLTAQVPALLTAVAAGLIVTRSSARTNLSSDIVLQLTSHPAPLWVAAGLFLMLAVLGMPLIPMLGAAGLFAWSAYRIGFSRDETPHGAPVGGDAQTGTLEAALTVEPLELQIGYGLVRLADERMGGDLLERISLLRHEVASEIGIVLPSVRVHDDIALGASGYRIRVRGRAVANGVVDPDDQGTNALVAALYEAVRGHAHELLTHAELQRMLDRLTERSPQLVRDVVGSIIKPAELRRVLKVLLRERVPIRDIEAILEAVSDAAARTHNIVMLAEAARRALGWMIVRQYAQVGEDGILRLVCMKVDPSLEAMVAGGVERDGSETRLSLPHGVGDRVALAAQEQLRRLTDSGLHPVILTTVDVRHALKSLVERRVPQVAVLSTSELDGSVQVESRGVIRVETVEPVGEIGARMQGVER